MLMTVAPTPTILNVRGSIRSLANYFRKKFTLLDIGIIRWMNVHISEPFRNPNTFEQRGAKQAVLPSVKKIPLTQTP